MSNTWIVGFSGGLDSTVLLHRFALSALASADRLQASDTAVRIIAVHINHQLQVFANEWGRHCAQVAKAFSVEFVECKLKGKPAPGESLEAWARAGRIAALVEQARLHSNSTILLAHHLQDQAETLIYRLLRGSGASGLASMQVATEWHGVPVQRPLLGESRDSLVAYAQAQNLKWIDDPSNKDERLARNAIRAQVIPSLKRVLPDAMSRIANSAQSLGDDAQVLAEVGAADFADCGLSAAKLGMLSKARAANALRSWVRSHGLLPPSRAVLHEMVNQLVSPVVTPSRYTHSGQIVHAGWVWTRYRDKLFAAPLPAAVGVDWLAPPQGSAVQFDTASGFGQMAHLSAGFAAHCEWRPSQTDLLPASPLNGSERRSGRLAVRVPSNWIGNLRVEPLGGASTFRLASDRPRRSLKAHCQSLGIASIARPWLPVIMYQDTALIAAAIGVNWEVINTLSSDSDDLSEVSLDWRDTHDSRRAFL